jgi:NitT/TauT family transport system permease protein
VSIFLIWFGSGEISKVLLLFYTAVFIITLNTMAGVAAVSRGTTWAARSLGASERQILLHVLLPQTVPYIYTGLRLALANTFITIVAVEMMAAKSGVGYLIWSSRDFMLTDQVFAAIIAVGLMGIALDRLFHYSVKPLLWRFGRR